MARVKTWDAIVVGGGVIGLSLALELRKQGASVLVVDRSEPGREASHAAAGMLAWHDPHHVTGLEPLIRLSTRLYPEFVHELEDESGARVDLRDDGTILLSDTPLTLAPGCSELTGEQVVQAEANLAGLQAHAYFLPEATVDPRALVSALLKATKHRGVEAATGAAVTEVVVEGERAAGVKTERTHFSAATIVNCAGAWAGQVGPRRFPARPIKGQMLALIPSSKALLRHVVRSPEVYLVPRSDGRIVIGSTLEDVGYDKRVEPDTVQRLHQAAANLVPELGQAKMLEAWAGLRPGTPDNLPMLGASDIAGYFVAAGHYRDGILLAPATAHVMAQVVQGRKPDVNLEAFSPMRF
jgi:glycine oxidase